MTESALSLWAMQKRASATKGSHGQWVPGDLGPPAPTLPVPKEPLTHGSQPTCQPAPGDPDLHVHKVSTAVVFLTGFLRSLPTHPHSGQGASARLLTSHGRQALG